MSTRVTQIDYKQRVAEAALELTLDLEAGFDELMEIAKSFHTENNAYTGVIGHRDYVFVTMQLQTIRTQVLAWLRDGSNTLALPTEPELTRAYNRFDNDIKLMSRLLELE